MGFLRTAIETAVAEAVAEYPKYFTPKGIEHAKTAIVRKVMAALRDGGEKQQEETSVESPKVLLVTIESREALGYANLRLIAGANVPKNLGDGRIAILAPANCDAVYAFAEMPPRDQWRFIADKRLYAWGEFFREMLPETARRSISIEQNGEAGIVVPWPFPPSKTGKIYAWDEDRARE